MVLRGNGQRLRGLALILIRNGEYIFSAKHLHHALRNSALVYGPV